MSLTVTILQKLFLLPFPPPSSHAQQASWFCSSSTFSHLTDAQFSIMHFPPSTFLQLIINPLTSLIISFGQFLNSVTPLLSFSLTALETMFFALNCMLLLLLISFSVLFLLIILYAPFSIHTHSPLHSFTILRFSYLSFSHTPHHGPLKPHP